MVYIDMGRAETDPRRTRCAWPLTRLLYIGSLSGAAKETRSCPNHTCLRCSRLDVLESTRDVYSTGHSTIRRTSCTYTPIAQATNAQYTTLYS